MLGVSQMNIARSSRHKISHIVQRPMEFPMTKCTVSAIRTRAPLVVPALPHDLGARQILNPRDALARIGPILSHSRHDHALLGWRDFGREI